MFKAIRYLKAESVESGRLVSRQGHYVRKQGIIYSLSYTFYLIISVTTTTQIKEDQNTLEQIEQLENTNQRRVGRRYTPALLLEALAFIFGRTSL